MDTQSGRFFTRCIGAGAAIIVGLSLAACGSMRGGGDNTRMQILRDGRQMAFQYVKGDAAESPRRIVLIHGAPADASSWTELLKTQQSLLAGCELIAVDRMGYGASMPARSADLEEDARAIEPLLEPGTIVVGHSYGAPIALRLAAAYPERVGAVVLIAGATDPGVPESRWAQLGDGGPRSPTAEQELLALAGENAKLQPMLGDVVCPVVVIHGDADPLCPRDRTLRHLEDTLQAANLRIVSIIGGGHHVHRTHPRLIAEELARLAESLEPVSTHSGPRNMLRPIRQKRVYRPCDFRADPGDGI